MIQPPLMPPGPISSDGSFSHLMTSPLRHYLGILEEEEGLQDAQQRRELAEKEIARLQESLVAVRQNRLSRRALFEESRRLSGAEMLTIPAIRDDSEVAATLSRIGDIEVRMSRAAATLGDRHPDMVALQQEIEAERKRVNRRIAALRESIARDDRLAQREEADIMAAIARAQKGLPDLEKNALERSFIQRQAEARQKAVGDIIDKSVREGDEEMFFSPKIIQKAAIPTVAISPQKTRNFQYALGIGLLVRFRASPSCRRADFGLTRPRYSVATA